MPELLLRQFEEGEPSFAPPPPVEVVSNLYGKRMYPLCAERRRDEMFNHEGKGRYPPIFYAFFYFFIYIHFFYLRRFFFMYVKVILTYKLFCFVKQPSENTKCEIYFTNNTKTYALQNILCKTHITKPQNTIITLQNMNCNLYFGM